MHISNYLHIIVLSKVPFSALTLLIGRPEGHLTCKKRGLGLLVVTFSLKLCTSYSSVVTTTSFILGANKIQNGDNHFVGE